jgi:hypothetical protein
MNRIDYKLSKIVLQCDTIGCNQRALSIIYKFPNTYRNRKKYKDLLNQNFNIGIFCEHCADIIPFLTEQEFILLAKSKGFKI